MSNLKDSTNNLEELREFQRSVHENAQNKGFWEDYSLLTDRIYYSAERFTSENKKMLEFLEQSMIGQKLALIHSEVSEALEGVRHGNPPDDKVPNYNSAEAELADAMIRIMDLAEFMDWDVIGAMIEKSKFNTTRPYKHGKKS